MSTIAPSGKNTLFDQVVRIILRTWIDRLLTFRVLILVHRNKEKQMDKLALVAFGHAPAVFFLFRRVASLALLATALGFSFRHNRPPPPPSLPFPPSAEYCLPPPSALLPRSVRTLECRFVTLESPVNPFRSKHEERRRGERTGGKRSANKRRLACAASLAVRELPGPVFTRSCRFGWRAARTGGSGVS